MLWDELVDGQQIKILQEILELENYPICTNENWDIFITREQLNSGFNTVAKVGDIGIWDKENMCLKVYLDQNDQFFNSIPFGDDSEGIINKDLFEIVEKD